MPPFHPPVDASVLESSGDALVTLAKNSQLNESHTGYIFFSQPGKDALMAHEQGNPDVSFVVQVGSST